MNSEDEARHRSGRIRRTIVYSHPFRLSERIIMVQAAAIFRNCWSCGGTARKELEQSAADGWSKECSGVYSSISMRVSHLEKRPRSTSDVFAQHVRQLVRSSVWVFRKANTCVRSVARRNASISSPSSRTAPGSSMVRAAPEMSTCGRVGEVRARRGPPWPQVLGIGVGIGVRVGVRARIRGKAGPRARATSVVAESGARVKVRFRANERTSRRLAAMRGQAMCTARSQLGGSVRSEARAARGGRVSRCAAPRRARAPLPCRPEGALALMAGEGEGPGKRRWDSPSKQIGTRLVNRRAACGGRGGEEGEG